MTSLPALSIIGCAIGRRRLRLRALQEFVGLALLCSATNQGVGMVTA